MKYFTYLENIEAEQLFEVIHKEHPQTIAIILVYIDADVAADILSMFTDDIKADIAIRMSQFNSVPDALIKSISDTLINKAMSALMVEDNPTAYQSAPKILSPRYSSFHQVSSSSLNNSLNDR